MGRIPKPTPLTTNMALLTEGVKPTPLTINMALLTEGVKPTLPNYKHGPPDGGRAQTRQSMLPYVIGTAIGALSCILPQAILRVTSFKLPFWKIRSIVSFSFDSAAFSTVIAVL